jgi:hypothetical protein
MRGARERAVPEGEALRRWFSTPERAPLSDASDTVAGSSRDLCACLAAVDSISWHSVDGTDLPLFGVRLQSGAVVEVGVVVSAFSAAALVAPPFLSPALVTAFPRTLMATGSLIVGISRLAWPLRLGFSPHPGRHLVRQRLEIPEVHAE